MALTLGDIEPKKKKSKKVAKKTTTKKKAVKKATGRHEKSEKARPWHSPDLDFAHKPQDSYEVVREASGRAAIEALGGFEEIKPSSEDRQASSAENQGSANGLDLDPIKNREQRRRQLQKELMQEWLLVAEQLKNRSIKSLPEPLSSLVKESWLGKIELAPVVRIPVPEFFQTKS